MGILGALIGNASEAKTETIEKEYGRLLAEGERIEHAYKLIRDVYIFTDLRLILVEVQGVTGKKTAYHSIPYASITHFSVETAGHFDLDAELKLWIKGMGDKPMTKTFTGGLDVYALQRVLARRVSGAAQNG